MNQINDTPEKLIRILKEDGLDEPSAQFSAQLTHSVLQKFERTKIEEPAINTWLGKLILSILVSFNILILLYLIPLSIQPVLTTSLVAFILGLWGLIGLIKKAHRARINSWT